MNYCPFNEIKNLTLEPISFYFKTFDYDFRMGMHHHPYFEIMYAYQGSFDIYIQSPYPYQSVKKLTVQQRQFIFLDAMTYHRLVIPDEKQRMIYNVELEPKRPSDYNPCNVNTVMPVDYYSIIHNCGLEKLGYETSGGGGKYTLLTDTAQVEYALKNLIALHKEPIHTLDRALAAQYSIVNLFLEISECLKTVSFGALSYIKKANEYIANNYVKKISLDDIAEHVGINKSYLQRQYKKYTGSTILNAINTLRVKNATYYLKSTPYPVKKIAEIIGFSSKQQIEYEFQKRLGVSPSDYRKQFDNIFVDHYPEIYRSSSTPFSLPASANEEKNDKK